MYQYTSIRVQFGLCNWRINDVSSGTSTQAYVYNLDYNWRINDVSSGTITQVYLYNLDSTTDESKLIILYQYTSIRVQFRLYNWRINACIILYQYTSIRAQFRLYNWRINVESSCTSTQVYVHNLDSTTDESTMYHLVPVHKYTCTI
jgi:hypothetical protein